MDRIDQIKIPTLALCGDQDIMTPPKYSHFLAGRMPKAKAVVIEGGTHMVFAEKPDEVNRAIDDFILTIIE
jgi:pimeloyl-ACP methyl ester carboxylesterase